MPTNRPFLASFFSAFRARSSPTFQAKSTSTVTTSAAVASAHATSPSTVTAASTTRGLTTKAVSESITTSTPATTTTTSSSSTARSTNTTPLPFSSNASSHRYAPPLSRSPGTATPTGSSYATPNMSMSPGASTPTTRGRQRRGSDSSNSSGGFMDALGAEKWYIGGRTAAGEESFYRLAMVTGGTGKRVQSLDRLSL